MPSVAAGWPSVLFFVFWVTVGKWIILTLFLSITLAAFEQSYATVTRTTTGGAVQVGEVGSWGAGSCVSPHAILNAQTCPVF